MKPAAVFVVLVFVFLRSLLPAQDAPASRPAFTGKTVVVIPFESAPASLPDTPNPDTNNRDTPNLDWLGESFPEAFHDQLNSPLLYLASRDERLRAYDRQGIPATVHPSRATVYRLAEQMDVDYAVLGTYRYEAVGLTASAQLLDMRAQKLLPAVSESAPLGDLGNLQSALAWDLLRQMRSDFSLSKGSYLSSVVPVSLDAQENYIRALLAPTVEERLRRYREATRLNPNYARAWLELGKTYYRQRAYELAIAALSQVSYSSAERSSMPAAVAREANFYLGLSAYAHGDYAKSATAFEFVAARLPLAEVYNNLGVVAAHRGQKKAADYFERAIQNDPSDADYHFNLGATLAQSGDHVGALRELRAALDRRPSDAEAKTLLDSLTPSPGSLAPNNAPAKPPLERIKRNYEEDSFRQMTMQIGTWAEERFARSDPRTHARYHIELGKELLAHGFSTEAEAEFRHAAAIDPTSPVPLAALAEAFEANGDTAQARAQAEAALRIRESADAYVILARLDLRENKIESAAHEVDRALELEPANSSAQDLKRALAAKLAEKAQP